MMPVYSSFSNVKSGIFLAALCALSIFQLAWCEQAKLEEAPVVADYFKQTYFNSKNNSYHTTHKIKKTILQARGIRAVSHLGITYGQDDRVRVISAVVTQPDGKKIQLKKKQMDRRLVAGSGAGLNQDKHLSFLFPELKVGSQIELIYECFRSGKNANGQAGIYIDYSIADERVDSLYDEYTADSPWHWKSKFMEDFDVKLSEDKKRLTVQQKQSRYFYFFNEPSGGYVRALPSIALHTSDDLQADFKKSLKSWNDILKAPLPVSMSKIVSALQDKPEKERVIEILRYIRDHYRYLGDWRHAKRGWLPFSLAEIARHGYGDCKDLSAMLVAMLRASGIEAEPALVQRGLEAHTILLPNVITPNHAIVKATIGDKTWWLDPTNPVFLPDFIMSDIHNRWVLILGKDHQVQLDQIPRDPSNNQVAISAARHYDREGHCTENSTVILNGMNVVQLASMDYYQGIEQVNQALCEGDIKNCKIKRDKTDFLVPSSYPMYVHRSKKDAASVVGTHQLLVKLDRGQIFDLVAKLRHYTENKGQTDLLLTMYPDRFVRIVCPTIKLIKPVKEHVIQSPWFDYHFVWKNNDKDQGCVVELHEIRKADWLDHKAIKSAECQKFMEKVKSMLKDMNQIVEVIDAKEKPNETDKA